ncbi:hypothetical protein SP15_195 [Bacillus phage SP-15]|uniref:Uncharacterized protein n=1 Tax=Bacillus phage SP-15 TaxID=1792032 RepID=A0A127AWH4_9CAUD|nr:hypothetical protein SP15_195 [Bacillus phage SP-15]AMM44995.1 hypothetical protein SP15_195 [Bacillus phage SP-15]
MFKENQGLDPEELLPFCTRCFGVGISYGEDDNSNFCHMCGSQNTCVPMKREAIAYTQSNIDNLVKTNKSRRYTEEDCVRDTREHIQHVQEYMSQMANKIIIRGLVHDASKLESPELETFTEYTPKLANTTYGSEEYFKSLEGMKVALNHHYQMNSHHPEHYENGINGMDLLDLVEMICDWKAATLRHNDGDIKKSLETNRGRFKIDSQLYEILSNTIDRYFNQYSK